MKLASVKETLTTAIMEFCWCWMRNIQLQLQSEKNRW